ncbi:hypothetical protein HGG78_18235 [Vibrio aestuarianus]|uniref:hypothetical protein n=1 Tax=Vibrio aestuarianus TaxID=28171 RepID=UPI001559C294|nr:hypothetical protein [Vibrio aestuarianus]NGZ15654.1 hypothetical protein [Vibrio aestuarianus]NKZ51802.1 hypothetical protein [Vibrio aestuarianus]
MIFGNVFTTHFKLIPLLLTSLLYSSTSLASFIEGKQDLQFDLANKYQALDKKMKECSTLKKRPVTIDDPWLKSLPEQTQRIVLFELYKKAQKRCSQSEETAYIAAAVELAIIGEEQPLNEYIKLRTYDSIDPEGVKIIEKLDEKELKRVSQLHQYQYPFDLFSPF